jgi:hypothetical protein
MNVYTDRDTEGQKNNGIFTHKKKMQNDSTEI